MRKEKRTVVCHDRLGKLEKVPAAKLSWRPSVYGLLFKGTKVLLSPQWGGYDFPGGGMMIYETVEEGLKREFWEETGLKVEPVKIFHAETSFYMPQKRKDFWNVVMTFYLVKQVGGKISKDNFDEDEKKYAELAQWIEVKDVGKLKFYNSVDSPKLIREAYKIYKRK
jgi:ADP-ribose pyrophosphatase YjhB (NUDIX family)